MNRRLALLLGVLVSSGAAFVLVPKARLRPQRAVRVFDRRCRGGCTDTALLRILPGGVSPGQTATGSLSTASGGTITTTRASNKTCTKSDGTLVYLTSNQPCVELPGLLVEGSSTNLALWSQALDNAAWTKSGTGIAAPTVTADQAVAPDGTLTADRIDIPANSSTSNRSIVYQTFSTAAAPFTCADWFKGVSGSGTIYLAASDGTAGAGTTTVACPFNSTTWTKCSAPRTSGNYTYCTIGVDPTLGTALPVPGSTPAISVYAWGEQGEALAFASSYIPTTGSTASRAADVISVANPLTAAFPFYMAATFTPESGASYGATGRCVLCLGTESSANSMRVIATAGSPGSLIASDFDGAAGQAGLINGAYSPVAGSTHRFVAGKTALTSYVFTDNGSSSGLGSFGTGTGLASQPSTIYLGGQGSGDIAWGYLSDICVAKTAGVCL